MHSSFKHFYRKGVKPDMNREQPIRFDTAIAFQSISTLRLRMKALLLWFMGQRKLSGFFMGFANWALTARMPISFIFKYTIYPMFCGGEHLNDLSPVINRLQGQQVGVLLNFGMELKSTESDFEYCLNEILTAISLAKNNRGIKAICVKISSLVDAEILEKKQKGEPLSSLEWASFYLFESRINRICDSSAASKVALLFDAEESWIQNEIDLVVERLMYKYNRHEALIFNTFQMYRTGRLAYLESQVSFFENQKYILGVKLVRGAYLEKERSVAGEQGKPSTVHAFKIDTDTDFEKGIDICLGHIDHVSMILASQNEDNHLYLARKMGELGIQPSHPHVSVSQLYGMGDIITFSMANAGYNASKYLPYGPVNDVIPYLIRRMNENSSVTGQMGREWKWVRDELIRRSGLT